MVVSRIAKSVTSVSVVLLLVCTAFQPMSMSLEVDAAGGRKGTWGLNRPLLDGYLGPGRDGLMAEWDDDAPPAAIKMASSTSGSLPADLRVKSIGTDLYVALEVQTTERPHVFLVTDLDGDGNGDHMVASLEGLSAPYIARNGEWEPLGMGEQTYGAAAASPARGSNGWTFEMVQKGPPNMTGVKEVGWYIAAVDPSTGKGYWYPPPRSEDKVPDELPDLPPLDKGRFERMRFDLELDLGRLVTLFPRDPRVSRIEVTQAVQTGSQEMQLVKGKTSMARVFVDTNTRGQNVTVVLYGAEMVPGRPIHSGSNIWTLPEAVDFLGSMTRSFLAPVNPLRRNLDDSANFLLPRSWTDVDLLGLYAEVTAVNGVPVYIEPRLARYAPYSMYQMEETHDLVTYVVPVNDTVNPIPSLDMISSWTENMTNVYPMADPLFPILGPEVLGPYTGSNSDLLIDLTEILYIIVLAILLQMLFGQEITYDFPDQIFGVRATGGGLSDPVWAGGDSFAACGGPSGTSRELIMAHEIQHNIGPDDDTNGHYGRHPGGGGAELGDPDWTALYGTEDFTTHDLGWDPSVPNRVNNQDALVMDDWPDFMSYCQCDDTAGVPDGTTPTKWISTYRWPLLIDRLQNWRLMEPELVTRGDPVLDGTPTVRVIRGTVPKEGTPSLEPTYEVPGTLPRDHMPSTGTKDRYTYKVHTYTEDGTVLDRVYIDPVFVDADQRPRDEDGFVFFTKDNGRVKRVELLDAKDTVLQSYTSVEKPSVEFLQVPDSFKRGMAGPVSWKGIYNRSEFLQYRLEYSPDGVLWFPVGERTPGTTANVTMHTLPGSDEGRFRLRATNGLDTSYAISPNFDLPNQKPTVTVSGGPYLVTARSSLAFHAAVSDPDLGKIDPEDISWYLDGAVVAAGASLDVAIVAPGSHTLEARYTDPSGSAAVDTVTVTVVDRPTPTTEQWEEFERAVVAGEDEPGDEPDWILIIIIVLILVVAVAIVVARR